MSCPRSSRVFSMMKMRLALVGAVIAFASYALIGRAEFSAEAEAEAVGLIERFGGTIEPYTGDKGELRKTGNFLNSTVTDADFGSIVEALAKIPNLLRKPLLVDGKRALQGVDDPGRLKSFVEGKA